MNIRKQIRYNINFRKEFLRKVKSRNLLLETLQIIDNLRKNGVAEVKSYYKNEGIKRESVFVSEDEINLAVKMFDKKSLLALIKLKDLVRNMADTEKKEITHKTVISNNKNFRSVIYNRPLKTVGIYVPRNLPSSLIFYCQLAKTAGVENVILALPPEKNGAINPPLLVAASLFGIKKIIAVGGRRAFPALAFGISGKVPDKLFGPCSLYVDYVKQVLNSFYKIPIDIASGPSELLIFIDDKKHLKQAALDIKAQVEHGYDSRCLVVSTDKNVLKNIAGKTKSIRSQVECLHANSNKKVVEVINKTAPEILEIFTEKPEPVIENLVNIANVYVNVCSPLGDYCLFGKGCADPTYGMARGMSGVTIDSFYKKFCVNVGEKTKGMRKYNWITKIPEIEGFKFHKQSIENFLYGG